MTSRGGASSSSKIEPCSICGKVEKLTREHVRPAWYLRDMDRRGGGPYEWSSNGEPIITRKGKPVSNGNQYQRVLLPVCSSCNGIMARRFEHPESDGVRAVRRLTKTDWVGSATRQEWRAIGLWLAKNLTFIGRDDARWAAKPIDDVAIRFGVEPPPVEWLIDGGEPPKDLSLWAFHTDARVVPHPEFAVPVPVEVIDDAGTTTGFPLIQEQFSRLQLVLMWHPGWEVEHPLLADGRAWELLHAPPADGSDLAQLPVLPRNAVRWWTVGAVNLAPGLRLGEVKLPPWRHTDEFIFPPVEILDYLQPPFDLGVEHPALPSMSAAEQATDSDPNVDGESK